MNAFTLEDTRRTCYLLNQNPWRFEFNYVFKGHSYTCHFLYAEFDLLVLQKNA